MKVITTAGNKGGIGKSTIALTLAQYLAKCKNMKGAFIDLDPQGNSSSSLIPTTRAPSHPTAVIGNPHFDLKVAAAPSIARVIIPFRILIDSSAPQSRHAGLRRHDVGRSGG